MDFAEKYTDKEILIIGGGTSTLDVKWEGIVKPDTFIWTCNDFYKNERVRNQNIDLYQLGFETDLSNNVLRDKLRTNKPFTYYEPTHYRAKHKSDEFKEFQKSIGYEVPGIDIGYRDLWVKQASYEYDGFRYQARPAQKSGAIFRLIILAIATKAKKIYFVGFDGFNKNFTNKHAFTGNIGLKDTDTRRTWKDHPMSYVNVFEDAYKLLAAYEGSERLQNLGEGFDYNLGTKIRSFFLKTHVYQ